MTIEIRDAWRGLGCDACVAWTRCAKEHAEANALERAKFKETNLFHKLAATFLGLYEYLLGVNIEDAQLYVPADVRLVCFEFLKRALNNSDFEILFDCMKESKVLIDMLSNKRICECPDRGYEDQYEEEEHCHCGDNETRRVHDLLTLLITDEKCKAHFEVTTTSVKVVTVRNVQMKSGAGGIAQSAIREPSKIHVLCYHFEA